MIKIKLSKAFTLIELLVVIGIISVLIAILMPALSAVLETSRTTKCSSNLRQIGAAMFLYAGENGGYFPESGGTIPWGTKDSTTNKASWMEQLSVYMNLSTGTTGAVSGDPQFANGSSIFTCPSSSLVVPQNKFYSYFNGAHAAYAATAAANGGQGGYTPVKQQSIAFPSKQILSGDCNIVWPGTNSGQLDADKDDYSQDPFDNGSKALFHRGQVNILFADGHVSSIQWNPTLSAYFDPTIMATHYSGSSTDDPANKGYLIPY